MCSINCNLKASIQYDLNIRIALLYTCNQTTFTSFTPTDSPFKCVYNNLSIEGGGSPIEIKVPV